MTARYRTGGSVQGYIRLLQTGNPVSHIHFDVARKGYFGKKPPHFSHKLADVNKVLQSYYGCRIDLHFKANYFAPSASLQPGGLILAGFNQVVTRFDGSKIELTGAQLKLSDAPIDGIDWRAVEDYVMVNLIIERANTVSETYITDTLEITNAAFKSFVLGKSTAPRAAAGI